MVLFAVKLEVDKRVSDTLKEFNERLNGEKQNPALIFFDGRATLLFNGREQYILFNVRLSPFEPPFYKYIFYFMFKRALKKKGYKKKTRIADSLEFSKLLEGYV